MAARAHTIRVSDHAWEIIHEEAVREEISANAWIVEAAMGRAAYARTIRDDPRMVAWEKVEKLLRELRD
jgi:hypothetical protein